MKRAAAISMSLALSGCYSFSTLGRAHTVGQHHLEVFAAPEGILVATSKQLALRPIGEIGARYGVTKDVDIEARVTTLGGLLAAHVQILRGDQIEMLVAPGFVFTAPDKASFELPLATGIRLPHDNEIVIAPRLVYQLRAAVGVDHPLQYAFVGLSAGFAWRIVKHLSLMPEVATLGQLYAPPGFASNVAGTLGIQLAVGVLLDF